MKIKKGEEVRIRRTNQIATIEEVELIRKAGKVHKYCHLKTSAGQADLWMDAAELEDIHEVCEATFSNHSNRQVIRIVFDMNHKTESLGVTIIAVNPVNLKVQRGLHEQIATLLLKQFR